MAYELTGDTVRFPDVAGTASIEDVLGDLGRVEIDFDGAIRYRARAPTPGASFGAEIGIGGSLTAPPLPHHPRPGLIGHLDQRDQRLQTGPGTRPVNEHPRAPTEGLTSRAGCQAPGRNRARSASSR
jgi:hypothetical protein